MGLTLTQHVPPGKQKVFPLFQYYYKGKKTKIFSGVDCLVQHWDVGKKQITRGDKEYRIKNLKISSIKTRLDEIINRYEANGEVLLPKTLRLELQRRESIKEAKSISSLPLKNLIEDWENDYMNSHSIEESTKSKTKSVVKDIKHYIQLIESERKTTLLIDDLNDDFCRDFSNWLFNKPSKISRYNQKGLQPHSVARRFQYLQTFCKWYSKNAKEFKKIDVPRELKSSTKVSDAQIPICLYDIELEKLVNCKKYDFLSFKKMEDDSIEWVENDEYMNHLTNDRNNRKNLDGVLEYFYDETKYGLQTYTNYEVYKDIFVFLCSVGCRYSDGIKMKLSHFKHKKRSKSSTLEDGVEAFFEFPQKKTNMPAIPRVNEVSYEIYKKYSRGKKRDDYLFPRTQRGNFISDVHFNKHIKRICERLNFNRVVVKKRLGSKGKELGSSEKRLWEVVSSHTGRKTFIKTLVLNGNFTTAQIKSQTGHLSERSFEGYYKITERDLMLKPNSPFLRKRDNYIIDSVEKGVEEIEVNLPPPPSRNKTLKEKLIELEESKDIIGLEKYEEMKDKLLDNFI